MRTLLKNINICTKKKNETRIFKKLGMKLKVAQKVKNGIKCLAKKMKMFGGLIKVTSKCSILDLSKKEKKKILIWSGCKLNISETNDSVY